MPAPVVHPLEPVPDVLDALEQFAAWPHPLLLHSALVRPPLGRCSFLTADPVAIHQLPSSRPSRWPTGAGDVAAFRAIRRGLQDARLEARPDLPPFQGGAAGLLCYEAGRLFERLPATAGDGDWPFGGGVVGLFDWVLAWDHLAGRAWVIVQPGLLGGSPPDVGRAVTAELRLRQVLERLHAEPRSRESSSTSLGGSGSPAASVREAPVVEGRPLPGHPSVSSNFMRDEYVNAVEHVLEYIRAGDLFQANLSQRLSASDPRPPWKLFRRLCEVNPAPFAGYFDAGPYQVLSASPERFLQLTKNEAATRPIKGTRARRSGPEADLFTRDELRESEKDRAENVMIVDLLRNDLSRVCQPGSLRVPQLCTVETYETVQHLVSEVRGRLRAGQDFFDLLAAAFPGGSVTGAPKIRAMEIISELERVPRGPYCGSLFYVSADGAADSSLLIRTITRRGGLVEFPVGGGITIQSNPGDEYAETLDKAAGLLRAIEP